MTGSGKAYLAGALGTMSSRAASIVAGVLSLWFLTRILGTEAFAGYSVAMSVVVLLGYSVGLGIERSLLVRIGELEPDGRTLAGGRLLRANLISAGFLAGIATLLTVAVLRDATGPQERFTLYLAPVIPATALSLVLMVWYQANHRVGISQAMFGVSDAVRSLCFAIAFGLGLGAPGVVAGAILGAAAPALLLALGALGRAGRETGGLARSDLAQGLQFLLMRLSTMGLQHIDIIALGALGSVVGTAQYAVAKRVAVLVQSGQSAFAPTFIPRVRRNFAQGREDLAEREYRTARVIGFAASLLLALGFVLLGEPVLVLFGNFGFGFDAFMLLTAAHLLTVGFGFHAAFLSMTEDIGWSTANRIVSVLVFALCLLALVPRLDALGASLAFLIATILHDAAGIAILRRRFGIVALDLADGLVVVASTALLCAAGLGAVPPPAAAAGLLTLLAATGWRHRALFSAVLRDLAALAPRRP